MFKLFVHFSVFLCLGLMSLGAQEQGYRIEVELKGYEEDTLYLAYHLGDKQYIRDTVGVQKNGTFVFEGEENLEGGLYLIVLAPNNEFFQILVDKDNQRFAIKSDAGKLTEKIEFEDSKDNARFYKYLNYISEKRPTAEKIRAELSELGDEENEKKENLNKQLDDLNKQVEEYQLELIEKFPKSLTAAIIKANLAIDVPEFEGNEEEKRRKRWRYSQQHFFDNIDLSDPRLLRTPFLFPRIDQFVSKLQVQHPDTIAKALDYILEKTKPAEGTFKYLLIHYLNEFSKSKIVGMDAVYVHLVDNYYRKGLATWTGEDQLKKILESADKLKPLLIGKIAPNILMEKRDGSKIALHEVDSEYTILYFWRYDCGHCKKSTPFMKEFYEKFKDRGVEIFSICTKFTDEIPKCWEYIDENEIQDWLHTVDPYHQSRFSKIYDIRSTPQMYILDAKKEIISKKIGAEQLEEVMDKIIEMKKKEKEAEEEQGKE